jgi:hypothetical protein
MTEIKPNPLMKHFRQPKLYIDLPSKGLFYPQGTLELTEDGKVAVYAMTAKDEIMIKTPDALLNGQSTVSVIENCVPGIKNGWVVPNIDLDALLTAIRIATYGEMLSMEFTLPGTTEERAFETNLVELLDELVQGEYETSYTHNEFTIETAPMTYKQFTDVALKTFEEQRIIRIVDDNDMSESEKIQKFNETFKRLTDININNVYNSVKSIKIGDQTVTDKRHLDEFLQNAPVDVYKSILDHIDAQRTKFTVKPRKIITSEEDRAAGAPDTIEVPINFDASNFFALGS